MTFLASCGEDDPEDEPLPTAPSLSLSGDLSTEDSFEVGDSVAVTVTFTTPGELSGFNYQVTVNKDSTDESVQSKVFQSPTDIGYTDTDINGGFNFIFSESLEESLSGKTVTIDFEVVDKADQLGTDSWTFEVTAGISEYQTVLIGAQLNTTLGSFYDATENEVYLTDGARDNNEKIDLIYYYLNTEANPETAIMASPDNDEVELTFTTWPFTTENSTKLKTSSSVYADVTSSVSVASAYSEVGDDMSRIVGLAKGDVVAFQLDASKGSKYGVFEVESIDGEFGSERTITINVKIQN